MANRRKLLRSSDPDFLQETAANFRDMTTRLRQPEIVSTLGQLADLMEARARRLNPKGPRAEPIQAAACRPK